MKIGINKELYELAYKHTSTLAKTNKIQELYKLPYVIAGVDGYTLTGTNIDNELNFIFNSYQQENRELVYRLPPMTFSKNQGAIVYIEKGIDKFHVTAGNKKYSHKLNAYTFEREELYKQNQGTIELVHTIKDTDTIAKYLDHAILHAGKYDTNNILGGVEFNSRYIASSDGGRLYHAMLDSDIKNNSELQGLCVPIKTCKAISSLLKDLSKLKVEIDTCHLYRSSSTFNPTGILSINCEFKGIEFKIEYVFTGIEGQRPFYEDLIPSGELIVSHKYENKNLLECLNSIKNDVNEVTNCVKLKTYEIIAENEDTSTSVELTNLASMQGMDLSVNFNIAFLLDALKCNNFENISIYISKHAEIVDNHIQSPCLFKVGYEEKIIIMPLKQLARV